MAARESIASRRHCPKPYAYDPPTVQFLREIEPLMADNVAMLGAILQRAIMNGVENGMSLETAVANAAAWHAETVAQSAATWA